MRRGALYPTQADAAAFRAPQTAGFTGWGPRLNDNGTQVVLAPVDYTLQYENTLGAENPTPLSITLQNTTFTENTAAGNGGGISIISPEETDGTAPFTLNAKDSVFLDNTATLGGGASLVLPEGCTQHF